MNKKQKFFCEEYVITNDFKKASENAGYSLKTTNKLLKDEKISSYIKELKSKNNMAKSQEVIDCLTEIMRGKVLEEGKSKAITIKERLKAAELLGKVYAIFGQKQDISNDEPVFIVGSEEIKD